MPPSLLRAVSAALLAAATAAQDPAPQSPTWRVAGSAPEGHPARTATIDFNRDIRPILSDRCFQCHGADRQARKADLRLDTWAGLTGARADGLAVVVPGSPDRSLLVARVDHGEPGKVMPPPTSGLSLTARERDLLRQWIEEGVAFAPHWAFVPPSQPTLPAVRNTAAAPTPMDRFVQARLETAGIEPRDLASRRVLIRRVTLDLTGLPPTPEEIEAFERDESPDAYDRLLDRLFASPRYGERMGQMWLDAARYADTNGFHHDNVRTGWPYRDWVLRAFQDNLPFDRFVIEQLAGDLVPDAGESQRIATAFCRMHNINDEGGALDLEYRVEAVCDRIETIATTFMGLTMNCARCHDHKYDPLTQEDYYSLYAFFNSVDERGVYPNNFEQARAYPARLLYQPESLRQRLQDASTAVTQARAELDRAAPSIEGERMAWEARMRESLGVTWNLAKTTRAVGDESGELEPRADGSFRVPGKPKQDTLRFTLEVPADADPNLRLLSLEALPEKGTRGRIGLATNGNVVVSAVRVVARSTRNPEQTRKVRWAWAWADHSQPNGDYDVHNLASGTGEGWALQGHERRGSRCAILMADEAFGFEGGTIVEVEVECRSRYDMHVVARPRVRLGTADPGLLAEFPTVASDWWEASPFTLKGNSFDAVYERAFGPEKITTFVRGQRFGKVAWTHRGNIRDGASHALRGTQRAFYFARTIHSPVARKQSLFLGSDDAVRVYLNGASVFDNKAMRGVKPDQDLVELQLQPGENVVVVKIINGGGPGGFYARGQAVGPSPAALDPIGFRDPEHRAPDHERLYVEGWGVARSPTYKRLFGALTTAEAQQKKLEGESVPVLVMQEMAKPAKTYVLARGSYDGADETRPVDRRPPLALGLPLPEGAPRNRLGLARWLVRDDHPLTARVHVNRIWQMLFGTGLVATTENFGQQADWPSHPQLLDWLAVKFVESGWDQQKLLRTILHSATYRRDSRRTGDIAKRDPTGRLLASFPRRRLAGEFLRDQALYVAGLLHEQVGGPSVRPYQPAGLWREVSIGGSSNTQVFRRDSGDALYRRSLYTFWKRTSPNPQMATFDAPTREFCVVRRATTNTPLQALVLWNDEQFVEAARRLAVRVLTEREDRSDRMIRMFELCTGRRPDAADQETLARAIRHFEARYDGAIEDAKALLVVGESTPPADLDPTELAAWSMLATTILSLDETLVQR